MRDGTGVWVNVRISGWPAWVLTSLLVAAFFLGGVVWLIVDRAGADEDSARVYCLAPAQNESLVNAAIALELATPGKSPDRLKVGGMELEPTEFRRRHGDDFDRACTALFDAAQPRSTSLFTTLLPAFSALAGAAIAFAAASWRDKVARSHTLSNDLRESVTAFITATEEYLKDWRPDRTDAQVAEQRGRLRTQLSRARAVHPSWDAIDRIDKTLTADLGESLATGWMDTNGQPRRDKDREKKLRDVLGRTHTDIFLLADAVQQPVRARHHLPDSVGSAS